MTRKVNKIVTTSKYDRALRKLEKKHRYKSLKKLKDIVDKLSRFEISSQYKNHPLKNANGVNDIHIENDLILLYRYDGDILFIELKLFDVVNHNELNKAVSNIKGNKDMKIRVYSNVYQDEYDLDRPEQEFDSAETSINSTKLPAIYRMISIPEGTIGVDFGGGKFDNAVAYVRDIGATLCVYDPYNRSAEHNREVVKMLKENGRADWAVNSNVLNVIKEPEARKAVLENISKITKSGAPIYITVYEGRGDRKEGQTKSGYQLNRKTQDYLEDIQEVFPDAKRQGKLITAHNVRSIDSSINASTDGFVYTYCDNCGKKNRVEVHFKDYKSPFDDTEFDCKYCGAHNLLIDPHEYDDMGYVI